MIRGDAKDQELNMENNTRLFKEHFCFVGKTKTQIMHH